MSWTVRMAAGLVAALACACAADDATPPIAPGWMSEIDDARKLSSLSIPGTHESAALYEPADGIAKCQELTIERQLAAGVRYFDIRCRHLDDAFAMFHGPVNQLQTFDEVLDTMHAFLDEHPTETLVMSVKEESVASNTTRTFEQTFAAYVAKAPDRWALAPAIPLLGDVRGKVVLLRRFDAIAVPLGIDASSWADNTTFSLSEGGASLRVQDAYKVTDNAMKWAAISDLLGETAIGDGSTLFLNYTSGYQGSGLPNNQTVARVINPQLDELLIDPANARARLGVLAMDHVTESRVAAVARTNVP